LGRPSYQLTNRYGEPSQSQVFSYKWHTTVVCELSVPSDAWNLARRRALDRLAEEAIQVRADTWSAFICTAPVTTSAARPSSTS
jgi:hypothetical protein